MLAAKTAGQHRFQTYCGSTGVSQPLNMSGIVVKSPIRRNVRRNSLTVAGDTLTKCLQLLLRQKGAPEVHWAPSLCLTASRWIQHCPSATRRALSLKTDQQILDLIQQVPKKTSNPCLETFYLYPIAQRVYQAVTNKKLLSELGVYIQDKTAKRKIYQLVFDTLYREF